MAIKFVPVLAKSESLCRRDTSSDESDDDEDEDDKDDNDDDDGDESFLNFG